LFSCQVCADYGPARLFSINFLNHHVLFPSDTYGQPRLDGQRLVPCHQRHLEVEVQPGVGARRNIRLHPGKQRALLFAIANTPAVFVCFSFVVKLGKIKSKKKRANVIESKSSLG
jgi:hypothetical protein